MVTLLNFDEVYKTQSFYRHTEYESIDLRNLRNVNGYCEARALAEINKKLKARSGKGITFIGSGNYHYVTYLLLGEINEPFTLVMFDYHTDLLPGIEGSSLLSCGSWVLHALKNLPFLVRVVIVGINEELIVTVPKYCETRVSLFTVEQVESGQKFNKQLLNSIPTKRVYISIDKDVLLPTEAVTNWDQGNMTLDEMLSIVRELGSRKIISGLDVCGEYTATAATSCLLENRKGVARNNRANRAILDLALQMNAI